MRWDNLSVEAEEGRALLGYREPATIRTFDAPEALDTRFYEVRSKSALNRVPKASRMPFRWTINPYRGCAHSCKYCFARPTHTYLDFNAGRDFEKEIVVKVNVPEVARAELMKPRWKREHVALGHEHHPYQWVEGRYKPTPGIWEAMRDPRTPSSVVTKSLLLLRDIDLMQQIDEVAGSRPTSPLRRSTRRAWRSSRASHADPRKRIEAVGELIRQGIPCGVLIVPLMPGINDSPEQVEEILDPRAEAGAEHRGDLPCTSAGRSAMRSWTGCAGTGPTRCRATSASTPAGRRAQGGAGSPSALARPKRRVAAVGGCRPVASGSWPWGPPSPHPGDGLHPFTVP